MPAPPDEDVYIGLGSNRGDRRAYIERALNELKRHPEIQLLDRSSIIETKPVGERLETPFLNAVVKCHTTLSPFALLNQQERIELELGRTNKGENAPRKIDLDLLFFGRRIVREDCLRIPHPEAHNRSFVLTPMVELAPDFTHPVRDRTMKELLNSLSR